MRGLPALFCLPVILAACLGAGRALATPAHASLRTVVVATGFIPNVEFTPYYVAQDLGYYRAAGLNVQMNDDQIPNLLQLVGTGKFDFAVTTGDAVIPARAAHIPVTYVMAQYQRYPIGAMALAHGGVPLRTPADLKGHRIGYSGPNGPTYIGLRALLKAGHLGEKSITETNIGFTETEALIAHRIDIAMTFIDNEPVQARALGYPVTVLPVARYMPLVGPGVATSDTMIRDHPQIVQAFVTATLRGLRYTLQHPARAFAIAMKRTPEITDPRQVAIQRQVLTARLRFQQPPAGHPLGWTNPHGWKASLSFFRSIGVIKRSVRLNSLYTSIFTNTFAQKANA